MIRVLKKYKKTDDQKEEAAKRCFEGITQDMAKIKKERTYLKAAYKVLDKPTTDKWEEDIDALEEGINTRVKDSTQ